MNMVKNGIALLALITTLLLSHGVSAQEQTWRMTAKNADVHEFIAQVAEITGKTFIVDQRLKGTVTVISDTPLDKEGVYELFLSALRLQNYTAIPSGDVIRIQPTNTGKQAPGLDGALGDVAPAEFMTRVIAAQNVDSAELVKILRPLIPQYGHIAAVPEPNVVIISDHADNIVRLQKIINQIDVSDDDKITMRSLKEAWVGQVVEILEIMAPEQIGRNAKGPQRVQIVANERNNSLILRGKPSPVDKVLKIVDQLDQPATTTDATQVVPLSHADAVNVANILGGIISAQSGDANAPTQEVSIQADETLNAIVVRADPGTMQEVLALIEKLDVRRAQVMIEVAIAEVTLDDTTNIGVELAAADGGGETLPLITTSLTGVLNGLLEGLTPGEGDDATPNVLAGLQAIDSPTIAAAKIDVDGISFAAVVNALKTNTNANLLSAPMILTLDNQEARILVGQEVPFRTGTFTTTADGTNNPFTTVQREDVGVELLVTPHVHESESIRLNVAQEITSVLPTVVSGTGFSDVVTSKRTIETAILAENQQTIVLGGLIQDDITNTDTKVPFFGNIPVIGNLFRNRNRVTTKTNLLVFLRPTVIRSAEDAKTITDRKYGEIWEVGEERPIDDIFNGLNEE